jgi:hypothetical protein
MGTDDHSTEPAFAESPATDDAAPSAGGQLVPPGAPGQRSGAGPTGAGAGAEAAETPSAHVLDRFGKRVRVERARPEPMARPTEPPVLVIAGWSV